MTKKRILMGCFFVFLVLGVLFGGCVTVGGITYSEGERTGTITKFSHRGLLLRTWEGELNVGGFEQGGTPIVWKFSVSNPETVEQIKVAQRKGGRWTLKYRQQLCTQSWKGETDYFVVEVVDPNG